MRLGNGTKIGISWTLIVTAGLYAFYLSKSDITSKRVEHIRTKERMLSSNTGKYEPSYRKYANES